MSNAGIATKADGSVGQLTFGGTPVVQWNGTGLVDPVLTVSAPTTSSAGYLGITQNAQAAGYTCVLSDAGKQIYATSAGTFTIPANASVAYPIGTVLTFINMQSSSCTLAITTDTLYWLPTGSTGSRTLAQYGLATATKISSTSWVLTGVGIS